MSRATLCMALARFKDQPLTMEVARAIVLEVHGADQPIDIAAITPVSIGGYTIAAERLADLQPVLHVLHLAHWAETEKHRHGLAMNPDYAAMRELERCGRLLQLTIRNADGLLVGHLRMYVSKSLHTSLPIATEDTLFILPEHRTASTGHVMVRAVRMAEEIVVRHCGAREVECNSKVLNQADLLMKRVRYRHVANQFSMIFDEEGTRCAQDNH